MRPQLFDHRSDPGEAANLAYQPAHAPRRNRMLDIVMREWAVDLVGPRDAERAARVASLGELAGCYNRSVRCARVDAVDVLREGPRARRYVR